MNARADRDAERGKVKSLREENTRLSDKIAALKAENERLRAAAISTMASLAATISLLERGGKRAAPSDKMFAQMLVDYHKSLSDARAALETTNG